MTREALSATSCHQTEDNSDLISRADAIEAIASRDKTDGTVKVFTGRQVNEILHALPSARPTGEWVDIDDEPYCKCSKCGTYIDSLDDYYSFCPFCGADMRGGEDE